MYDPQRFRVERGPIFQCGRLDGTARILVLGQDPGQHESAARRCLVGEALQRVQGFLAKLGIDHFYVAINAFLYSVCGQPTHSELDELLTAAGPDRHAWLDALLLGSGCLPIRLSGSRPRAGLALLARSDATKNVEILVLGHEVTVLRRHNLRLRRR